MVGRGKVMEGLQKLLKMTMTVVLEMEGQLVLEWMQRVLAMEMVQRLGWKWPIFHWTCS